MDCSQPLSDAQQDLSTCRLLINKRKGGKPEKGQVRASAMKRRQIGLNKTAENCFTLSSKVRPIFVVAKDSRELKRPSECPSGPPVMPVSLVGSDAFCTQHSTTHEGSTRSEPAASTGAIPETTASQCGDKIPPITFELTFTFTVLDSQMV
ncbi:hypothetical protein TNIN_254331 [Trichonephila inaurata madagascariensis]|uniref:Uncharacterized protein n=1 Tax=Trichonephila inaurata madagascariensis TaxID=2747483 RepID=A0A8X6XU77_9ARAC|nr:hypothetical protein TNIN_254331 [Trichonephila inaurata madagascariensis]